MCDSSDCQCATDCQGATVGKIAFNPSSATPYGLDLINHPPHYTQGAAKCACGRTIECIDITRHLSFNLGNAIKYIWRCDWKGNSIEDLKKAVFYLNDEIRKRGGGE